ncbi:MAG: hypothetical protein U5K56_21845 [Halioglobus sp.]|nr:hypothetical protein [Halioglobus sp.]
MIQALHRQISRDREQLLARRGITVSAIQLFEKLPKHSVITMPLVTRLLGVSKPTAGKAIELLIDAGLLEEIGQRKRDRMYRYGSYLRLLD